jgi:hypothetical protein
MSVHNRKAGAPAQSPYIVPVYIYCRIKDILGMILERLDGVMWTGLVWLRIGTSGELL